MRTITKEKLKEILNLHVKWLRGEPDGVRADLRYANLSDVDLSGEDLRYADLRGADLMGVNLRGANLRDANLRHANLSDVDLSGADLRHANLMDADLGYANLRYANLMDANLRYANLMGVNLICPIACPEKGGFTAFKNVRGGYIVELYIPADAKRCSATSRKCRCDKAKVISITTKDGVKAGITAVASMYDVNFVYEVGKYVSVENFEEDRWKECAPGIHFFITRDEAVNY